MNKTTISWTDLTWNPVTGCTRVSEGCRNCYAEALSKRFGRSFEVTLHPDRLDQVRKIPAGSRVFVNSMSDLFHPKVPADFIQQVVEAMRSRPDVEFQVLTKRPERMVAWAEDSAIGEEDPPMNVLWGVSVEDQAHLQRLQVAQHIHRLFVSFEPLLGPIDLPPELRRALDWAIIGGESGSHHRPMKIEWARELVRNLKDGGIPVFVKQMGGVRPGGDLDTFPPDLRLREFPLAPGGGP